MVGVVSRSQPGRDGELRREGVFKKVSSENNVLQPTSIMAKKMMRPRVTGAKRHTGGGWHGTQYLLGWPLRTCGAQDGILWKD